MRGRVELLAPGMAHRPAADGRPEMLRGPGDILERRRHGPQAQALEHARGVEAQGTEEWRQRTDHRDGGHGKPRTLPSGEPGRVGGPLALGAVAIATGGIAALCVATLVTRRRVPPRAAVRQTAMARRARGCSGRRWPPRARGGAILLDHRSHGEWRAGHKAWASGTASSGLGGAGRACGVTWRERLVRRRRGPSQRWLRRSSTRASQRGVAQV